MLSSLNLGRALMVLGRSWENNGINIADDTRKESYAFLYAFMHIVDIVLWGVNMHFDPILLISKSFKDSVLVSNYSTRGETLLGHTVLQLVYTNSWVLRSYHQWSYIPSPTSRWLLKRFRYSRLLNSTISGGRVAILLWLKTSLVMLFRETVNSSACVCISKWTFMYYRVSGGHEPPEGEWTYSIEE